jgi:DNA polymerase III epsilon subunit-like protein
MGNFSTARGVTFLDTETTGLDPAKSTILQISIITDWEDGNQSTWTTKIKPRPVELEFASQEALHICRYSDEEWKDAPTFEEVAPEIAFKLAWGPIVGHNINFDLAHLRSIFKRYGWKEVNRIENNESDKKFKIGYPIIDTCALAYLFLPTDRQNMDTLREYFNIDGEGSHEAEKDTLDCRQIFYEIVSQSAENMRA